MPLLTHSPQENLGLAAEHGFYWRPNARSEWLVQDPEARFGWKDIVHPILQASGAAPVPRRSRLTRHACRRWRTRCLWPCLPPPFCSALAFSTKPLARVHHCANLLHSSLKAKPGWCPSPCPASGTQLLGVVASPCTSSAPTNQPPPGRPQTSTHTPPHTPPRSFTPSPPTAPSSRPRTRRWCGTTATPTPTLAPGRPRNCWTTWRGCCPTSP